jgi:hypothetical protein
VNNQPRSQRFSPLRLHVVEMPRSDLPLPCRRLLQVFSLPEQPKRLFDLAPVLLDRCPSNGFRDRRHSIASL